MLVLHFIFYRTEVFLYESARQADGISDADEVVAQTPSPVIEEASHFLCS
jgi:hypothetical protein